ncbi:MAG: prepilin-type N-terminal cleavage/methylation domain-containing protein [Verrucomicrobiales bacterium]|jgi:prepilin-type N-terminal cleavage/methylation domain-containing protein
MTRFTKGFTMPEMLSSIAIIGIMSGIAATHYTGIFKNSKVVINRDFIEQLNNAVKEYQQNAWEITVPANDTGTDDELKILRSLQYDFNGDPSRPFGVPYFRPDWNPTGSSGAADEDKVRVRWNGATFEVVEPDTEGEGLIFSNQGEGFNDPFDFSSFDEADLAH